MEQLTITLILRSITGMLSILGSAGILYLIFKDRKTRRRDTLNFYKIMSLMSFFDIMYSACYPLNWWGSRSQNIGCKVIGFLFVFGQASTYANASLSIYYVLVINLNKKNEWIEKKALPFLLIIPTLYSFITACIGIGLNAFGFNGYGCWFVGPHQALLNNWVAGWGPVFLSLGIIILCMLAIVYELYKKERQSLKYKFELNLEENSNNDSPVVAAVPAEEAANNNDNNNTMNNNDVEDGGSNNIVSKSNRSSSTGVSKYEKHRELLRQLKRTRKMTFEAILYIFSFFFSYIWLVVIAIQINNNGLTQFVTMGYSFGAPLQGFFNFLNFYRRYSPDNGRHNNTSRYGSSSNWSTSSLMKKLRGTFTASVVRNSTNTNNNSNNTTKSTNTSKNESAINTSTTMNNLESTNNNNME